MLGHKQAIEDLTLKTKKMKKAEMRELKLKLKMLKIILTFLQHDLDISYKITIIREQMNFLISNKLCSILILLEILIKMPLNL